MSFNKYLKVSKIIVAPLGCYLGLHLVINQLFLYPLIFGLVLGFVNLKTSKTKPALGFLLCLLLSYLTFFIAYFSIGIFKPLLNPFLGEDQYQAIGIITAPSVIAPMLVFYAYKFIFHFPKTRLTNVIQIITVVLLVIQSYLIYNYFQQISFYLTDTKMYLSFVLWQTIMALALQLILYQKELKNLFVVKK